MLPLIRFLAYGIAAVTMMGAATAQDIAKDKQTKLAKYLTPLQTVDELKTERAKVLFLTFARAASFNSLALQQRSTVTYHLSK